MSTLDSYSHALTPRPWFSCFFCASGKPEIPTVSVSSLVSETSLTSQTSLVDIASVSSLTSLTEDPIAVQSDPVASQSSIKISFKPSKFPSVYPSHLHYSSIYLEDPQDSQTLDYNQIYKDACSQTRVHDTRGSKFTLRMPPLPKSPKIFAPLPKSPRTESRGIVTIERNRLKFN
jgi:hypothetical protein